MGGAPRRAAADDDGAEAAAAAPTAAAASPAAAPAAHKTGDDALEAEQEAADARVATVREDAALVQMSVKERLEKQPPCTISYANGEVLGEGKEYLCTFSRFEANDYMLYDHKQVGDMVLFGGIAPAPLVYAKLEALDGGARRTIKVTGDGLALPGGKGTCIMLAARLDNPIKVGIYNIKTGLREEISLATTCAAKMTKVDKSLVDKAVKEEVPGYIGDHAVPPGGRSRGAERRAVQEEKKKREKEEQRQRAEEEKKQREAAAEQKRAEQEAKRQREAEAKAAKNPVSVVARGKHGSESQPDSERMCVARAQASGWKCFK